LVVVCSDVTVKKHLIGKAAAPPRADCNTERKLFGPFGSQKLADFLGCSVGECDHVTVLLRSHLTINSA
jgi:hypothetical protein